LLGTATLFAVAVILYSGIWMYCVRWHPNAYLGIENTTSSPTYSNIVTSIRAGTPAERAGLQPGDKILAMNGLRLDNLEPFYRVVGRGKPGDVVTLSVARPGVTSPVVLHAALQPWPPIQGMSDAEMLAFGMVGAFPAWFVLVSLPVLFLRLEDRNAWLLALLFAGMVAGGPLFPFELVIPPAVRGFALAYKVVLFGLF
jgi:membrane-associated protease RseP (regulator of RpoE activity)